ncbi:hypothetical protein D3C85_996950 [compost metagenome]
MRQIVPNARQHRGEMPLIARIEAQRGRTYLLRDGDGLVNLRRRRGADLQIDVQLQPLGLVAEDGQLLIAQLFQGAALPIQDVELDPVQPLLMSDVQQVGRQYLLQPHVHVIRIGVQIEGQ